MCIASTGVLSINAHQNHFQAELKKIESYMYFIRMFFALFENYLTKLCPHHGDRRTLHRMESIKIFCELYKSSCHS